MAREVHLREGIAYVAYCGIRLRAECQEPRCTTFATEATCVRCLQLAVNAYERLYMQAKYGDPPK